MTSRRRSAAYTPIAIAFHWILALLIVANLALGLRQANATGLAKFELFQLHKSIGITVLLLSIGRLGWRLANPPPPLPAAAPAWERRLAGTTHWAFYGLMIALPLTGWALVSASAMNLPTLLYGTISWPHMGLLHDLGPDARRSAETAARSAHVAMTYAAYLLITLHTAAALKHHFWTRDGLLHRMAPFAALAPRNTEERS